MSWADDNFRVGWFHFFRTFFFFFTFQLREILQRHVCRTSIFALMYTNACTYKFYTGGMQFLDKFSIQSSFEFMFQPLFPLWMFIFNIVSLCLLSLYFFIFSYPVLPKGKWLAHVNGSLLISGGALKRCLWCSSPETNSGVTSSGKTAISFAQHSPLPFFPREVVLSPKC